MTKHRDRQLHQALLERKGGPFEAKAGRLMKRARQAKDKRRDIYEGLNNG